MADPIAGIGGIQALIDHEFESVGGLKGLIDSL